MITVVVARDHRGSRGRQMYNQEAIRQFVSRTIFLFCILLIIRCAEMFFQYSLVFLIVPFAFCPETIRFFVNLTGIIVADDLAEFIYLLHSLHRPQQPQDAQLGFIQQGTFFHFFQLLVIACKYTEFFGKFQGKGEKCSNGSGPRHYKSL